MTTDETSFPATISRGETGSERVKASVLFWRSPRTLLNTRWKQVAMKTFAASVRPSERAARSSIPASPTARAPIAM